MTATLSPLFTWRGAIASKESNLPPTVRHVAITLSLHMSERGDSCFPAVSTLCDETGLADSTVRDALRALCAAGWLTKEARFRADGSQTSSVYTAAVPVPPYRAASTPPTGQPVPPSPSAGGRSEDVSESVTEDVTPTAPVTSSATRSPSPSRAARDDLFQAVVAACGMDYTEMTPRQARSCGVAVSELVKVGATPDEVRRRALIYPQKYQAALTPNALANQWAALREVSAPTGQRETPGMAGVRAFFERKEVVA